VARIAALILIAMAGLIVPAQAANRFEPGQWEIPSGSSPQICIRADGTWYGTTYNWSGHWMYNTEKAVAVMFGNYAVNNQYYGYGNDTMTIFKNQGSLAVSWQDWFDDESYTFINAGTPLIKIKGKCDPPYTGINSQAPSQ